MYAKFRGAMFVIGVGLVGVGLYKLMHLWRGIRAGHSVSIIEVCAPLLFGGFLIFSSRLGDRAGAPRDLERELRERL